MHVRKVAKLSRLQIYFNKPCAGFTNFIMNVLGVNLKTKQLEIICHRFVFFHIE